MIYHVTVKPGSFRDEVIAESPNTLIVRTRKKAHDGEANTAVIELLSKHFDLPKTSLTIIKGAKSRHKTISVA